MTTKLKVALIRGSLPSYFPEKHNVWTRAETALAALCEEIGADLYVAPDVPMDGRQTRVVLDLCLEAGADFVLLLHGGFTMGDVARTIAASPVRAGFWSVPEPVRTGDIQLNNFVSLNMSMSIARLVRDLRHHPVQWYHGAPESVALRDRLRTTIRALSAAKALSGVRIGVVGGLAMTFYNMEVSTNALRQRLGVDVAHHDMHELTARMAAQPDKRVRAEVARMIDAAPSDGVSKSQMKLTGQAVLALREIAADNNYDALAVSDWPALQQNPGMHPGAAFSWLEEHDRLPVASEGDVLGAITQLVAKSLTGRVGYLLDMTEPDLESGQLLMWHGGGGPLYLADDAGARWINHPMIGRGTQEGPVYGAISDLVFADGPVSAFRVARDASALFQMNATVAGRDPSGFSGCRGWLEGFDIGGVQASLEDVVATVMAHGLEHHFVLVPGDISAPLAEFGAWTGMTQLTLRPMRGHLDASDFSG
jgi:L-fucose isomerase-like protein